MTPRVTPSPLHKTYHVRESYIMTKVEWQGTAVREDADSGGIQMDHNKDTPILEDSDWA